MTGSADGSGSRPSVRFADAHPNGLADLIGRLIEANLDRWPSRAKLLRPSIVELTATDADVIVTVRLADGSAEVANGGSAIRPHVSVVALGQDLLDLAASPLRFGLPDISSRDGRGVVRRIASRDVRVSGMLRHPVRMSRFLRLLSVAG